MLICSRCGAENKPLAKICRMCTNPLDQAEIIENRLADAPQEAVSTVVVLLPQGQEIQCPSCSTLNEPDYIFCQMCGTRLSQPASPAPAKSAERDQKAKHGKAAQPIPPVQSVDAFKTTPADKTLECPKCSSKVEIGSAFCKMCGERISVDHTVAMASLRSAPKARIRLIVDGEESNEEYEIGNETVVGRIKGDLTFPFDDYMSSKHASIIRRGNSYILKDEGSRNGTLIKIDNEIELKPGDMFLIGKQLFRFEI